MSKKFLAIFLLFLPLTSPVNATSVRPLLLDEIIDTAAVAFQGTCTSNRTERDPVTRLVVTYTAFAVKDVLKGDVKATHVIKQIGGRMPAGERSLLVNGVPTFVVGQEYVVLLAAISSVGFSSPIGLSQGKFTVQPAPAGKFVSNGRDFREMTARKPASAAGEPDVALKKAGVPELQLGLDEFIGLVRIRVGNVK